MTSVSIIVPIYNVEKYLRRCLDSLVNQTYHNVEILCINDGSKDASQSIVDEYVSLYPQVKSYVKENGGLSDARNFGLSVANGTYVMFVDGDDWLDLDAVTQMMAKAEEDCADIVCCNMEYVYESKRKSTFSTESFETGSPRVNNKLIFINNSACNKLYLKTLFDHYEFPKGMWYEDLASVPTLLASAKIIAHVDAPLYKYYQRANSISHKIKPDNRIFDIYKAIDKVQKEIEAMEEYQGKPYIQKKFEELYIIHGADLTTLRIAQFDFQPDVYLDENLKNLDHYYSNWYDNHLVREMGFKKRIVFFLLKHRQTKLLARLLGERYR